MTPPPADADGSVPATVLLPQSPLGPWSLDPVSSEGFPTAAGPAAELVEVRTGTGEGTQRLIFEFAGDTLPQWEVGYEPLPVLAAPGADPVPLAGGTALVIRLAPATAGGLAGGSSDRGGDGALRRVGVEGGAPASELVLIADAGGRVTWAAGVDARVPFAVDTLTSPARLVVDLLATAP